MSKIQKIAIVGIVGVPGRYGGFETLAENMLDFHSRQKMDEQLVVYCSGKAYTGKKPKTFKGAKLRFLPLSANGISSIPYDILSLFDAAFRGTNRILVLGVSGAIAIPVIKLFFRSEITTNIDGVEWKRRKWRGVAKTFLKFSEKIAVTYSHKVIADNQAIADYVAAEYNKSCEVIAYGGDHAVSAEANTALSDKLPEEYAFSLCRIEPENNVELILKSWQKDKIPLVFIGNWDNSEFGRTLKGKFSGRPNIHLLDAVYDAGLLKGVRAKAAIYIHGHSAGGTNPSLVEMMHFGIPVVAFDCDYNRHSTLNQALYFSNTKELQDAVNAIGTGEHRDIGMRMNKIAEKLYVWDKIGLKYFDFLRK